MLDRVLIVCVGNICRSPMAEGLLRARIRHRPGFQVSSAGVGALVGHPADPLAVELMAARGIDITGHRARQVTQEMLAAVDLVLVMEKGHQDEVHRMSPQSRGKVHRIQTMRKNNCWSSPIPPVSMNVRMELSGSAMMTAKPGNGPNS